MLGIRIWKTEGGDRGKWGLNGECWRGRGEIKWWVICWACGFQVELWKAWEQYSNHESIVVGDWVVQDGILESLAVCFFSQLEDSCKQATHPLILATPRYRCTNLSSFNKFASCVWKLCTLGQFVQSIRITSPWLINWPEINQHKVRDVCLKRSFRPLRPHHVEFSPRLMRWTFHFITEAQYRKQWHRESNGFPFMSSPFPTVHCTASLCTSQPIHTP